MYKLKKIDREYWLSEIAIAKKSAKRGYTQAAVRRLARLQRKIEKEFYSSITTLRNAALVHQLIAGVYSDAEDYRNANIAYLKSASLAFRDVYSSIDMITNALWSAENCARSAQDVTDPKRLIQVQKLNDKGSRFTKEVGDMLNDQLIDAKLPPAIFGGAYPAKVALTPEEHKAFERRRMALQRKNSKIRKALIEEANSIPRNESKK